ncbi:hypothetical protein L6452_05087 [Arctium lappa]|uniref:Uncharacterized protein n=1 Tax=Arctium lappa TaxID=4217 RepID=A0ACB9EFF1_ARCLA|nr:hypothetical protein L6452_05087 [Arctium lappa]
MKSPSVQYLRRNNMHKGMKKRDPTIEVSVSPKDSTKRTKVVASSEETTAASPSNIVVSEVAVEEKGETNDVMIEEVITDESME